MRGDHTNSASQRCQVHLTLQALRGGTFLTSVELIAGCRKETDGFVPALPGEIPSAGTSRQGQGRDPRFQDALPLRSSEDRPTGKQSTFVALADAPRPRPSLVSHVILSPPQGLCSWRRAQRAAGTAAQQGQVSSDSCSGDLRVLLARGPWTTALRAPGPGGRTPVLPPSLGAQRPESALGCARWRLVLCTQGLAKVGDLPPVPSPEEESPGEKGLLRGTAAPPPTGPGHESASGCLGSGTWPSLFCGPETALQFRRINATENVSQELPHLRGPRPILLQLYGASPCLTCNRQTAL